MKFTDSNNGTTTKAVAMTTEKCEAKWQRQRNTEEKVQNKLIKSGVTTANSAYHSVSPQNSVLRNL